MTDQRENALQCIVGEQLSAVTFVMDYVQFQFDGAVLSAFSPPVIKVGGASYAWGRAGLRDALCSLIGQTVTATSVLEGEEISIEFGHAGSIHISLDPKDYNGPEAAMFSAGRNDKWWVW